MTALTDLGWDDALSAAFAPFAAQGLIAGRVVAEDKHRFALWTEQGELPAEVPGRLLHTKETTADLPKVGDWVALSILTGEDKAIIQAVLPRRGVLVRTKSGPRLGEQILATNVDVLFIVQSLDYDFNLRRLERYLAVAYDGGVQPVIMLNKTDVCEDYALRLAEVEGIAPGVPVLAISALTGDLGALRSYMHPGMTFTIVGSSGVGKSTIINALLGDELQETSEVREHDHGGKHTTTRRQLILMTDGSLMIDTPGMRELQLWAAEDGVNETFSDLEELATQCRFSDCTHTRETRCAVRAAVERGEIPESRYENYLKLRRELAALEARQEKNAYAARKERAKAIANYQKSLRQAGGKWEDS